MQSASFPTTASSSQYLYKSQNANQQTLTEIKLDGKMSDQAPYNGGNRGSVYDRSGLYSAKLLSASVYSRQSYSSNQPFNHVSVRSTNLPTLEYIKDIKIKPTNTLMVSEAYNRDTLSTTLAAGSNRTTSRHTEEMSPGIKKCANYVESKQQDLSVSWLSESENYEEYVDGTEPFTTQQAVRDDASSIGESVILFSARGYEEKESMVASELDAADNKPFFSSFIESRNSVYVFNTNSNLKP